MGRGIPDREVVSIGDILIYVLHDRAELDLDPAVAGFRAVVTGHSHRPAIDECDGVLYVNPGSAGPRRFTLPISAGELVIAGTRLTPRLAMLVDDAPQR
jgi:predicted phosphodiesterase